MNAIAHFDASRVISFGDVAAVGALERALRAGLEPADDIPRSAVALGNAGGGGELLLMPSHAARWTGIKIIAVAPGNGARGLPRIQGQYTLFDSETLTPRATMDGAALTALRTPAVSMLAVGPRLVAMSRPARVVVFGTGPQAVRHARAIAALSEGRAVTEIALISRRPDARDIADLPGGTRVQSITDVPELVPAADVVITATTARSPLFDGSLVADGALVVAVGSHEPDARELDSRLLARAQVIVEDPATALREAGDIVIPVAERALDVDSLVPIAAVVRGRASVATDRPVVFKTTGMSWQDLVIAGEIYERARTL